MAFDLRRADTICAPATARGRGAIAIVRLSGPSAVAVRDAVFRGKAAARDRVAVYGDVVDAHGRPFDDAVCTTFLGPRSLTGEDTVELCVHGGAVVTDTLMARLVELGCRVAEPGEFTLRAVLAGKLDIARAEAVAAVIDARTERALRAAQRALRGGLHDAIAGPRAVIVDALAELEARLDFPDEPLGDARRDELAVRVREAGAQVERLVDDARRGRRLHDGARVVLWGAPNAGKSTLLNALVGRERALVDDAPGTTRDSLEVMVDLGGVPTTLIDVAGIRDGDDVARVERSGIERARSEVLAADVVVVVRPADGPPAPPLPDEAVATVIGIRSKADLAKNNGDDGGLWVCAHTGLGLGALRAAIANALGAGDGEDDEPPLAHTARQEQTLDDAAAALACAASALNDGVPDELVCSELRRAARATDALLGSDVAEDVLNLVFSRFCIGK